LKEKNIKFYFVYISSRKKYSSKFDGEIYPEVLKIISNLNIPILDMHKAFKNHPDPLSLFPFRRQLHYNEKGYSFVAEKIYDFVRNTEKDF
jgi:lysophospholipase L1-like esterase